MGRFKAFGGSLLNHRQNRQGNATRKAKFGDNRMTSAATRPASQPIPKRGMSRTVRWLLWIGAAILLLLLAAGTAIAILYNRAEPMLRASLIDTLQKRFHSRVELDNLHVSVVDGFQVEGSGLRIWLPAESLNSLPAESANDASWRAKPWIVVSKIRFHASWRTLPGKPIVISVIHAEGVRVLLPPKADRPHLSQSGESANTPSTEKQSFFKMPQINIQRIECNDSLLEIERTQQPGKPPKAPLDFEFSKATVIPDGQGGPMAFDVEMVNAKPVGNIHSTGHAGPWVPSDPGALPVEGDYTFDHADLSTIKGIAGILSSTGHYSGTLRKIDAEGQTETPDFRLERESKSAGEMLTTHFQATIDGTNGNTLLHPVDATLGHTHFVAKGQVLRAEDANGVKHGHDIVLDVTIDRGRIEDIFSIAADKVFLTGNLTLHTSFHLPAGDRSVLEKLQLNGQFHLSQSHFNDLTMQRRIAELSLRGQGKPNEIKTADPASILSDMQGHFILGDGQLQLPDLDYRVPGAEIAVHGAYGMQDGTLNFDGDAKLDASLSEVVGGWKGILLAPVDHYLRKNGAGTDVPIHVNGTRQAPKFGVDFDRLGKNDKPEKQPDPPAN